jgi:DnaJ-domain-containing protein 1
LNDSWGFLVIALSAVAGYVVVAAVLSKRDVSRKQSEDAREAKGSGRGETPPEQWYEILDVSPSASAEEIQAAFRTEISKYHPDRVASLGFELRVLAESRRPAPPGVSQ